MKTRRIILANESRLLREMLKRVIGDINAFHIIGETQNIKEIQTLIDEESADWIFVTLSAEGEIPKPINELLLSDTHISVLGLNNEGDKATISWMGLHKENYRDCSLEELIQLLNEKVRD